MKDPTKSERQRRWRQRSPGPGVTVHLSEEEVRVLDWFAVQLVEADPHEPSRNRMGSLSCGRSAALRFLIGQVAKEAIPRGLPPATDLADFWKAEAVWRRKRKPQYNRAEHGPAVPWTVGLGKAARAAFRRRPLPFMKEEEE